MAISNDELYKMLKSLPEDAKKSAFDYIKYLHLSHSCPDWNGIMDLEPEDIPLSVEGENQFKKTIEFVSWEDASDELNLSTDIK